MSVAWRVEPQPFDLRHDLLLVELAGELDLAVEQRQRFGQPRFPAGSSTSTSSRELARAGLEHAASPPARRAGAACCSSSGNPAFASPCDFRLEAGDARRHGAAPLADLAELGGELGVVDADQRPGPAARCRLRCTSRSRRRCRLRATARPGSGATARRVPLPRLTSSSTAKCAQISAATSSARVDEQQHARGARRAQLDRGADVVGEGEIGLRAWVVVRSAAGGSAARARAALQQGEHLVARTVGDQLALARTAAGGRRSDSSDRRCVEMMMVMFCWARTLSRSRNSASLRTSKCAVGSSRNTTLGLRISTRARPIACFWPPDRLRAALGDRHVVAERMAGDEGLDAGQTRRREHFLVGRRRPAERDVVAQLAVEQIGVLQHEADAGAQIGRIVLAQMSMPSTRMRAFAAARRSRPSAGRPWSCPSRRGR